MKQKLTESDIKLLISGSGMSLLDNQSSLNIIANYLNELVGPLIEKHITDSSRLRFAFTNVEVIPKKIADTAKINFFIIGVVYRLEISSLIFAAVS